MASGSPNCVQNIKTNVVGITVPVDGPTPKGAKAFAGTVITCSYLVYIRDTGETPQRLENGAPH